MKTIESYNPYTKEMISKHKIFSQEELQKQIEHSGGAFMSWKFLSQKEKILNFSRLSKLLLEEKEALAYLITQEMAKPIKQARAEIEKCITLCEYYIEKGSDFLRIESLESAYKKSYVRYDPLGVILGIMPWNFPFWQVFRFSIPVLLSGNTVLLKHAPNTTACGIRIQKLFLEAGFPKEVFATIVADVADVESMIANPHVQGVSLTGSTRAGRSVGSLAGKYLKKSVLELGGNDAFIVFSDADLKKSAKLGIQSRMLNSGQTCISAKRFLIEKSVKEKFIQFLIEEIKSLKIGNPLEEDTDISCLARTDLADVFEKQIKESVTLKARILIGAERKGDAFTPGLLDIDSVNSKIIDEEFFGPVAMVQSFSTIEELVEINNSSAFGLAASVWTSDVDLAEKLSLRLDIGTLAINDFVKSDPGIPFGGIKDSGYGRELYRNGIQEFTNMKSVYLG